MRYNIGYLVAAYCGAAVLYLGYIAYLLKQKRNLEGRSRGRSR